MKRAPEQYRSKPHSDASYGNNGIFIIPHPRIDDYVFDCIISDGEGWEHVSVTIHRRRKKPNRCPTWEEMCWVKELFFYNHETVVQYHPTAAEYVNNHPNCLHLWKPSLQTIPTPPKIMVGI